MKNFIARSLESSKIRKFYPRRIQFRYTPVQHRRKRAKKILSHGFSPKEFDFPVAQFLERSNFLAHFSGYRESRNFPNFVGSEDRSIGGWARRFRDRSSNDHQPRRKNDRIPNGIPTRFHSHRPYPSVSNDFVGVSSSFSKAPNRTVWQ